MYTLILVDYNSIPKTIDYIRHYLEKAAVPAPAHIVLVDNGPDDGTDSLEQAFGKAEVLQQPVCGRSLYRFADSKMCLLYCRYGENAGYARGNNLGMAVARQMFADPYYIISNNDLILPDGISFAPIAARFEQEPEIGVLGPGIVEVNGTPQTPRKKQSAFTKLIAWYWGVGPLRKYVDDIIYEPDKEPCQWVSGCFFFARAAAMDKIQGFDEKTFLYAEEMILSARMAQGGFTTVYDDAFTLIHDHRESYKRPSAKLKTIQISFDAISYYYKTYCGTSAFLLFLSKVSFALYKLLYPLWQMTKKDPAN